MALLVTFDGPKGVGKSTLIAHAKQRLHDLGRSVQVLTEKKLMAAVLGTRLEDAYVALKLNPGPKSELDIAELHRRGRVFITNTYLCDIATEVVLLDRWYPSDAVFRRHIDVTKAIEENLLAGVRVPDIAFAVSCDPLISWQRAHLRERRLDSKVISDYDDHVNSTNRFEGIASDYGWQILRSDSMGADQLSSSVIDTIESLQKKAFGPGAPTSAMDTTPASHRG
jgi:thymidylate kinase